MKSSYDLNKKDCSSILNVQKAVNLFLTVQYIPTRALYVTIPGRLNRRGEVSRRSSDRV